MRIHAQHHSFRSMTHRFPPFSRRENGRISAHMRATPKSGVPKEAQDNGLSASMSYGRQTLPRRPSGRNGGISRVSICAQVYGGIGIQSLKVYWVLENHGVRVCFVNTTNTCTSCRTCTTTLYSWSTTT